MMEINGLGFSDTSYLESIRSKEAANNVADFADTLRRTASAGVAEKPAIAGKAVIDKTDKLYEQCLELEIFMVKSLLSSMRNTIQKSGLIDEGFAGKMYEDMLYDEYARKLAENANFGMAEMAYLELTGQRGKTGIR